MPSSWARRKSAGERFSKTMLAPDEIQLASGWMAIAASGDVDSVQILDRS